MKPNPIGQPHPHMLDGAVKEVIELWEKNGPKPSWWTRIKGAWFTAVSYLIKAVDYLVRSIDDALEAGADKKATVLQALEKIYDIIVPPLLPLWLKPFNGKIKNFVIYVVASLMIDFIVGKYRLGDWPKTKPEEESVGEGLEFVD